MPITIDATSGNVWGSGVGSGYRNLRDQIDIAITQPEAARDALRAPTLGELVTPVREINQAMKAYGVEFVLYESDSRVITRVVDTVSGDVIRQIPNEAVLHVAERLDKIAGVLLNETA